MTSPPSEGGEGLGFDEGDAFLFDANALASLS